MKTIKAHAADLAVELALAVALGAALAGAIYSTAVDYQDKLQRAKHLYIKACIDDGNVPARCIAAWRTALRDQVLHGQVSSASLPLPKWGNDDR